MAEKNLVLAAELDLCFSHVHTTYSIYECERIQGNQTNITCFLILLKVFPFFKKTRDFFGEIVFIEINMVSLCSLAATSAGMVLKGNGSISSMLPFFCIDFQFFRNILSGRNHLNFEICSQNKGCFFIRISIASWRRKLAFDHLAAFNAFWCGACCCCAEFGRFCRSRSSTKP